ncbi:MAG TPA: FAD-dependent oxidoreductase, partial [Gemmatimonadales bacterium]|nr:FAD-dependent oxidoreductase [Gemmatimonadales bacterium]
MDVIVIGGGLSGLGAAERLVEAGASVTLLEARPRLGGRVHTEHAKVSGPPVDLGAEWLGEEGDLHALLAGAGARLVQADGKQVIRTDTGWRDASRLYAEARRLVHLAGRARGPDRSLEAALAACCAGPDRDGARDHLIRYVEGFHAADPALLSMQWLAEVERSEPAEASHLRVLEGVGLAVDVLHRSVGRRCEMRLDT